MIFYFNSNKYFYSSYYIMLKPRKRKVFFTKETKLYDGTSEANKNFYLFIMKYLDRKIITIADVACTLTNKEIFCYIICNKTML